MEWGSGLLYKCVDEIEGDFSVRGVDMRGFMGPALRLCELLCKSKVVGFGDDCSEACEVDMGDYVV